MCETKNKSIRRCKNTQTVTNKIKNLFFSVSIFLSFLLLSRHFFSRKTQIFKHTSTMIWCLCIEFVYKQEEPVRIKKGQEKFISYFNDF